MNRSIVSVRSHYAKSTLVYKPRTDTPESARLHFKHVSVCVFCDIVTLTAPRARFAEQPIL